MKKAGEDGATDHMRTPNAVWRPGAAPTRPPGDDANGADRAASAPVTRSPAVAVVLSLLALAATIIVLAASLALVGALIWPKTHTARAEILFPITQEQPTGFLREDRSMTTQLVLMQGRPVLGPIAEQQQRSVEELRGHLTVTVLQSSEIIELEVTDRSAERAMQTVQAIVDNYLGIGQAGQPTLRQRLTTELDAVNAAVADAQVRLDAQEELVAAGTATTDTATSDTLVPLQTALQAQQARQRQFQAQLDMINLAPVPQLLTPPYAATDAVTPKPMFAAVVGALAGVLLAAVVVAVVARNRTTRE